MQQAGSKGKERNKKKNNEEKSMKDRSIKMRVKLTDQTREKKRDECICDPTTHQITHPRDLFTHPRDLRSLTQMMTEIVERELAFTAMYRPLTIECLALSLVLK